MGIKRLYHVSDIHCRLFQRHKEYREVFDRFFGKVFELGLDDAMIVVTGDIVHSKTDMSPELISLVSYFLKGCADICPTLVIPGNHDLNLANQARLDALSPIVEALAHPKLLYWKESGSKMIGDIAFYHYSIIGDIEKWDIPKLDAKTHVGLYHGIVSGAETFTGFDDFSDSIPVNFFDGMDIMLLGDIHKTQYLNAQKTIAYPGSLIQQDYGEDTNRGFLMWDVESRTSKFIKVDNDYSFITVKPEEGFPDFIPSTAKVRVIHSLDRGDIKEFVDQLKTKFSIQDLRIEGGETRSENIGIQSIDRIKGDVDLTDINFQRQLLRDYLPDVDKEVLDKIDQINNDLNGRLRTVDTPTYGIRWKPLRFRFSNMFSYGEGNEIDFTKMSNIIGLFAPNAFGKSTLMDSIMYCIFDKCTRTNRAAMVMNNESNTFHCELEFMIGDERFIISRDAKRQANGEVKVDVDFIRFVGDERKLLNGKRRDDTNKIIRDYIGSYDDFVITTMSTQVDTRSFIDTTKKDRQELLYRFLNLHIFIELYNMAKDDSKMLAGQVKQLESVNYQENIKNCDAEIETLQQQHAGITLEIESVKMSIQKLTGSIENELGNKIAIDETLNIERLESELFRLNREFETAERDYVEYENQRNQNIQLYEKTIKFINDSDYKIDDLRAAIENIKERKQQIRLLEQERAHLEGKVRALETHEYDPNCQYCVRNQFVVDARQAEIRLRAVISELDRASIDTLDSELKIHEENLASLSGHISNEQLFKQKILYAESRMVDATKTRERSKMDAVVINEKIQLYNQQLENIERNGHIEHRVLMLKNERASEQMKLDMLAREERDCISSLSVAIAAKQSNLDNLKLYREKVLEFSAYENYMRAVNRDGIPYTMLRKILPMVEHQVNSILTAIVDFRFRLFIGESDSIEGKIVYGDSREWAIELVSGMERFILSLAIRSSLIQLSGLSKPNFMVIDEGFGVLDGDNLNSIHLLFDHLKKNFDFVLCISHILGLKDYVDNVINIEKIDNFSMIRAT